METQVLTKGKQVYEKGGDIMAQDPVCHMSVDESKATATSEYKGKTYYFCAVGCKERFDKEPEKYVKGTEGQGHSCGCC